MTILHIDMDAFYASVEEREDPSLVGEPVVVGGSPRGRGVVAAANYVARQFGIHSAMPAARAVRLCPRAKFIKPRFELYSRVSRQIRAIFFRYTPLVEPLSLDEAFLDVTGSEPLFGPAETIARRIKQEILNETALIASVGVAPNKFLAKIASDLDKPDGFVVVPATDIRGFLDPLPVGRLWGVGKVTGRAFDALGIRTIGDLHRLPEDVLRRRFGSHGEHLAKLARGEDRRSVVPDREAKSISHETTFASDIDDLNALRAWSWELAEQVARRLRRHDLRGRTLTVKVRFADFQTITRSHTFSEPTHTTAEIATAAEEMLVARLPAERLAVRLLGLGLSSLDRSGKQQLQLFDEPQRAKQQALDEVADAIKDRFGTGALGRAVTLKHNARHEPAPRVERDQ